MKRIFDILVGLLALAVLLLPIVIIALAVRITSAGPVLYWSDRIGLGG
ncbi:MAG: sugar transferase, partial [Gammaproteobacteria bacterium]|nr:sugar transferase [Gammaproteobacteria bacterium]MBT4033408.1 sugar transferase [Candidatus Neomarinimicrobiota bacterium]MBT5688014.1 sugar transferase [Gammaproteobacteria bacterium]